MQQLTAMGEQLKQLSNTVASLQEKGQSPTVLQSPAVQQQAATAEPTAEPQAGEPRLLSPFGEANTPSGVAGPSSACLFPGRKNATQIATMALVKLDAEESALASEQRVENKKRRAMYEHMVYH